MTPFGRIALSVSLLFVGVTSSLPLAAYAQVCVGKQCGNCYRSVPMSSQVGQRCPYCHCYWGIDREKWVDGAVAVPQHNPTVTLHYNGDDFDVDAHQRGGTLTVPVRTLEKFGAVVEPTKNRGVRIQSRLSTLELKSGSATYSLTVNGNTTTGKWISAPRARQGTTYLPIRQALSLFDYTVDWDASTKRLTVQQAVQSPSRTPYACAK